MLLGEHKQRLKIVCDSRLPMERRVFALMESVFMPVSFLTLVGLVIIAVLGWIGFEVPEWIRGRLMTVLVSAAIGYVTNWIAIEMLFKPYYPSMRHPFAWITLGYWRQGLVPKNKDEVAGVLGEQVATRLLRPEQIADDLCSMVGGILRNKSAVGAIRNGVRHVVATHDKEIAAFLAPRIEAALVAEIDRLVNAEKVESFWTDHIEPKLSSVETREEIASVLVAALEKRAPALAAKARPVVVGAIREYIEEKGGVAGALLAPLAEAIADCLVSKKTIESGLKSWLRSPDTVPALRDELLQFVRIVRDHLKSEASRGKVGAFVGEIRSTFKDYVRSCLETNLADVTGRLLDSEALWLCAVEMIPKFQPEIERLIRTEGMPLILEKLDIQGRIHSAVDKMDVAEFHGMINEVVAEHLGAIQVLGYLLGAAAGALTLLM